MDIYFANYKVLEGFNIPINLAVKLVIECDGKDRVALPRASDILKPLIEASNGVDVLNEYSLYSEYELICIKAMDELTKAGRVSKEDLIFRVYSKIKDLIIEDDNQYVFLILINFLILSLTLNTSLRKFRYMSYEDMTEAVMNGSSSRLIAILDVAFNCDVV